LQANTVGQQFLALEHWLLKDSHRVVRMKDDRGLLEARLSHVGTLEGSGFDVKSLDPGSPLATILDPVRYYSETVSTERVEAV